MADAELLASLAPRRHVVALTSIVKSHPDWRRGAEIGVAQGRTSLALLRACPELTLLAVEPFRYVADEEASGLYHDFDFAHNEACVRAVERAMRPRLVVMKMTSAEAAAQVDDHSLDFVFIDANHTYAEARRDILAWRPKVRRRGWVLGHDYSPRWPGVVRAVDEELGKPLVFDSSVWGVGV